MLDNTSKICPFSRMTMRRCDVHLGAMYNSTDFDAVSLMKFKKRSLTFNEGSENADFNLDVIPQNMIDETVLQKDHQIPVRCEVESPMFDNKSPN